MVQAHAAWRLRADELPDPAKAIMLLGEYMIQTGGGRYYAKAQNLARQLRAEYDKALEAVDILLMPTTPLKAPPLPPKDAPRELACSAQQRIWRTHSHSM